MDRNESVGDPTRALRKHRGYRRQRNAHYPRGVFSDNFRAHARTSAGPAIARLALGSEGIFGIVTRATLRVRPLPEVQRDASAIFPNFKAGVRAMSEMARRGIVPASVRLVDNIQFAFARALKADEPPARSSFGEMKRRAASRAAEWYVTKWHGFSPEALAAMTLRFEGSAEQVYAEKRGIGAILARYGGRGEMPPMGGVDMPSHIKLRVCATLPSILDSSPNRSRLVLLGPTLRACAMQSSLPLSV